MNGFGNLLLAVLTLVPTGAIAAENAVVESSKAEQDLPLTLDPASAFWRDSRPVYLERDNFGKNRTATSNGGPHALDEQQSLFSVYLSLSGTLSQARSEPSERNQSPMELGCRRSLHRLRFCQH